MSTANLLAPANDPTGRHPVARKSQHPNTITATDGFAPGLEFLRARRAQNLSWLALVEQSLRGLAELQKSAGGAGTSLARLSSAQASFVRDTASVYRTATTHLAR